MKKIFIAILCCSALLSSADAKLSKKERKSIETVIHDLTQLQIEQEVKIMELEFKLINLERYLESKEEF